MAFTHIKKYDFLWHTRVIFSFFGLKKVLSRDQERFRHDLKSGSLKYVGLFGLILAITSNFFNDSNQLQVLSAIVAFTFITVPYLVAFNGHFNSKDAGFKYLEKVVFESYRDVDFNLAIEGILNSEKARPEFVHVAPIPDEFQFAMNELKKKGFVRIHGKPGEGKSILSFNLAYRFRQIPYPRNIRNHIVKEVYKLNIEFFQHLHGANLQYEYIVELLRELDSAKGNTKILIVDDAHTINHKSLYKELINEVNDRNILLIWVSTALYEDETSDDFKGININFIRFLPKLINDFYEKENLKNLLKEKAKGYRGLVKSIKLNKPIERVTVHDPWHFNFIASKGGEKLQKRLNSLSQNQLIVLFHIAVHQIISGDSEVYIDELLKRFTENSWIRAFINNKDDLKSQIQFLQTNKISKGGDGQPSLIKEDEGKIKALHFQFSIRIIREILRQNNDAFNTYLIHSLKIWFKEEDIKRFQYISILHESLITKHKYLRLQIDNNLDWYTKFIKNPDLDNLNRWTMCLRDYCKHVKPSRFLNEREIRVLLNQICTVTEVQYASLAKGFETILKLNKNLFNLFEYSHWKFISDGINKLTICKLHNFYDLLNVTDRVYQEHFLEEVDFDRLISLINEFNFECFDKVSDLLKKLPHNETQYLLNRLDWDQMLKKLNEADLNGIRNGLEFFTILPRHSQKNLFDRIRLGQLIALAKSVTLKEIPVFTDIVSNLTTSRRNRVFNELNFDRISSKLLRIDIRNIGRLTRFFKLLDPYHQNRILNRRIRIKLAKDLKGVEFNRYAKVFPFIKQLQTDFRERLLQDVKWKEVADRINESKSKDLKYLTSLLYVIDENSKRKLFRYIDIDHFINESVSILDESFSKFRDILLALEDKVKKRVIELIDPSRVAKIVNENGFKEYTILYDFLLIANDDNLQKAIIDEIDKDKIVQITDKVSIKDLANLSMIIKILPVSDTNYVLDNMNWENITSHISAIDEKTITQFTSFLAVIGTKQDKLASLIQFKDMALRIKPSLNSTGSIIRMSLFLEGEKRTEFLHSIDFKMFIQFTSFYAPRRFYETGMLLKLIHESNDVFNFDSFMKREKKEFLNLI